MAPNKQWAIIWTNHGLVYWCIYVPPDLNDLTHWSQVMHICVDNQAKWLDYRHIYASLGFNELTIFQHWLRQCWNIVNWILRNKLSEILIGIQTFHSRNRTWKCCLRNGVHVPQCVDAVRLTGFGVKIRWIKSDHFISVSRNSIF